MALQHINEDRFVRRGDSAHEIGWGVRRLLKSVSTNRALVRELAKRELCDLHAGQAGGALWLIVHSISLFCIFAFLFTAVFRVRIGDGGPSEYLIYLFSGLAPWLLTQDVLSRATNLIITNKTIVQKVMFPTEVLVAKSVAASLAVQSVLMGTVIAYIIVVRGIGNPMLLLLPALIIAHIGLLWGLALLLSSVTPFCRDLAEIVRIFLTVNIYLMPIMYIPSMLPEKLRFALILNPFSHLIWCYQDVLYFGKFEHPISWVVVLILSASTLVLGSYVFLRLRHFFASIL